MDKTKIERMKDQTYRIFIRRMHSEDAASDDFAIAQGCLAYAALCQAEAMERIADAMQGNASQRPGTMGVDSVGVDSGYHNKGDQSIADAISEQVTDPPDVPLEDPYTCFCGAPHWTADALTECGVSHIS